MTAPRDDSGPGRPDRSGQTWFDATRLFSRLADAGPQDRDGELARCRAEEPELAAMLEALLASWDRQRPDRYEVRGEIASGGMGTIREALDRDLGRTVAVKTVRARQGAGLVPDADRVARFVREARITARLDHPGIVPLYDVGLDETGRPFFTMSRIRGTTLADALASYRRGEGWTLPRLLDVLVAVCRTMAYAHSEGVVHRDLKPSNVMVGAHGEVLVIDWGLAGWSDRAADDARGPGAFAGLPGPRERQDPAPPADAASTDDPGDTREGDVLGTPFYMSPEQARGDLGAVGPRADVYSIGAILYECLAGAPPYGDSTSETQALRRLLESPPPAPPARTTPPALGAIRERAMARSPADRYPDAAALADELTAFRDHRPVAALGTGPWSGLALWARRNRPLAAGLVGAFVLVLAIAAALEGTRRQAEQQSELARTGMDIATRAIDGMLTRVGTDILSDTPRASAVQQEMYADAVDLERRLLEQRPDDDGRLRYAAALRRMAGSLSEIGQPKRAIDAAEEALEVLGAVDPARRAEPAYRRESLSLQRIWIAAKVRADEHGVARERLDTLLARESAEDLRDPETLRHLGQLHSMRATLHLRDGALQAGIDSMERAVDRYGSCAGHGFEDAEAVLTETIGVVSVHAVLLARKGDHEAARARLARAHDLLGYGPDDLRGRGFDVRLATIRLLMRESEIVAKRGGTYEELAAPADRAIRLAIELAEDFPRRGTARWVLGESLRFAAVCADVEDELGIAADLYDRSLDVLHPYLDENPLSPEGRRSYGLAADARYSIAYQQSDAVRACEVALRRATLPAESGVVLDAATQLARMVTVVGPDYLPAALVERCRTAALGVVRTEAARIAAGAADPDGLRQELENDVWQALRGAPDFPAAWRKDG